MDSQTPVESSFSINDIAVILDMPPQTILEWLIEGRLFVNPAEPVASIRFSDPTPMPSV